MIMVATLRVIVTHLNMVRLQMAVMSMVSMMMAAVPIQMVTVMSMVVQTLDAMVTKLKMAVMFFTAFQMLQVWNC